MRRDEAGRGPPGALVLPAERHSRQEDDGALRFSSGPSRHPRFSFAHRLTKDEKYRIIGLLSTRGGCGEVADNGVRYSEAERGYSKKFLY